MSKVLRTAISIPALALLLAVGALAYFTASGSGAAGGAVGTFGAPTITSTSAGAGTVSLSWSTVSPPTGSGSVSYYVSRNGGTPAGSCPTSTSPSGATSCTDSGLSAGNYGYTVTAVWRSWTAPSSSASVHVNSGALDHFSVVAPAAATAGSAFSVTVTAQDQSNNTVAAYTGTIHFTSSDGQAVLPTNYTFVAGDSGSHTFNNAVTLKTAASKTITVNDTIQTAATGSATVNVSAASASSMSLSAATSSPTTGSSDALTITALDPYGNVATGYSGSKSLTFGGAHAIGAFNPTVTNSSGAAVVLGSATTITFTNGVASVSGSSNGAMTLYKVESISVTVSDGTIGNGAGLAVSVGPGAASSLLMTAATGSPTAGSSDALTITALDAYGNTATGYSGSKSLTFAGAHSIGTFNPTVTNSSASPVSFGSATAITFAAGVANNTTSGASGQAVATLYRAETATVTVTDGSISNGASPLGLTVTAGANAHIGTSATSPQTAGTAFNVTLTAQDAWGNATGSLAGVKNISFSGPANSPNNTAPGYPATVTFSNGTATASVTLYDAQTATITATDTTDGLTGVASGNITVGPAAARSFKVPTPATQAAGTAFNETVTALDAYGNTATSYTGSQAIAFSGPARSPNNTAPIYPATVTFTNGTGTASITLYDAQSTTLTATQGALTGTTASFTVSPAAPGSFTIPTPATQTAGTAFNVTLSAFDAYGNAATNYTGAQAITFSGPAKSPNNSAPSYPATVTFAAGAGTAAITLYDAQTTTLTATQGSATGSTGNFTVNAAPVSMFAFSSAAVTGASASNANLGPITVQEQDPYGNATTTAETVTLSSSSGKGVFSASQFGVNITSVSIAAGQSSASFFYGDQNTGTPTITGSKAGLTSATQRETITTAPAGLGMALAPGSTGNPSISCGAVSLSYTCNVTGDGSGGSVVFYATFVNSTGSQVLYSATQSSTITESGNNSGTVTIAAGASSSNPNTLTASHIGNSTKTSTLKFGPYTLTIRVSS